MKEMSEDTLEKLNEAKNYNKWIYRLCRPYLGKRLLEVGCGTGNMTNEFMKQPNQLMATDINLDRLSTLTRKWETNHYLTTDQWDVSQKPNDAIINFKPDTIVSINMLEHIEQDNNTLNYFNEVLMEQGKLVLFVPAIKWLYGTLDKELDHYRRYSKKELKEKLKQAGFTIKKIHFVNSLGVFGWWLNGRVLKKKLFSKTQISIYDHLIPIVSLCDMLFRSFIGQSLFVVAIKQKSD